MKTLGIIQVMLHRNRTIWFSTRAGQQVATKAAVR